MAYSSGTATDYLNLLSLLKTFLTSTALSSLSPSQAWTFNRDATPPTLETGSGVAPLYGTSSTAVGEREVEVQFPGLAGTDAFYGNITAYQDAPNNLYNWAIYGCTGYNSGEAADQQPGLSPVAIMSLWNSSIPYWFFASGRRCIVVAKISTVYEVMYLGCILPYGTPSQTPYPVFVGATSGNYSYRFSSAITDHRAFWDAGGGVAFHLTSGNWGIVSNYSTSGSTGNDNGGIVTFPFSGSTQNTNFVSQCHPNADGSYALTPIELIQSNFGTTPNNCNTLGALDGIYHVSGFNLGAEDTITVSGQTYLVVPDTFRTARQNYVAILEA